MSKECKVCEGVFSRDEKIIELEDDKYCEACFEELEDEL